MKPNKTVAIVGAGVSGLSAGCYACMNGFITRIYEMNSHPGGLCAVREKDGYTIDVCLQSVDGCADPNPYYRMWRELGMIGTQTFVCDEALVRIEDADGSALTLYADAKRLRRHLAGIAPEDRDLIREFSEAVLRLGGRRSGLTKPRELAAPVSFGTISTRWLPHAWTLKRWSGVTIEEFANSFDSPFVRRILPMAFPTPDTPVLSLIQTLAWMHRRTTGYPVAGSGSFVHTLERRFTDLGGKVDYGSRVERVLVENGRVTGLRLADGRVEHADAVIVASDSRSAVFDLLNGQCADDRLVDRFEKLRVHPSSVCVSIGLNGPIDEFPLAVSGMSFPLAEPKMIDGRKRSRLMVHAASTAPHKTVLFTLLDASYDEWTHREADEQANEAAQCEIVKSVIEALEERFPGVAGDVQMTDVITPPMWQRRTGNWNGSTRGWLLTPDTLRMRIPRRLRGVDGVILAGQWTEPGGGVSRAAMSGRYAAELLCRDRGKRFTAHVP